MDTSLDGLWEEVDSLINDCDLGNPTNSALLWLVLTMLRLSYKYEGDASV